jgi:hypothetical protein
MANHITTCLVVARSAMLVQLTRLCHVGSVTFSWEHISMHSVFIVKKSPVRLSETIIIVTTTSGLWPVSAHKRFG